MAEELSPQNYVLVIGAAGIDSKGKADGPLTLGTSTPGRVRVSVGGVARNVADNLARLGVETVLLSAVGEDGSGKRVFTQAREVGINMEYVLITKEYHTSAYLALLDNQGNLVMSVDDMRVLSCITPEIINQNRDLIRNAQMIVLDSNLSEKTIRAVLKLANRYRIPICADPTSTLLAKRLKPHLANIYMVTPNVAEAEVLVDYSITDEDEAVAAARRLVAAGVEIAIITLAEEGVVYATADASGHVPAVATNIIDTTGASDALTATVVFGLLNEIPIDESVRLGASAAALTLACSDTVCVDLSLEQLYDHLLI
jgi:pseudouridine kinase